MLNQKEIEKLIGIIKQTYISDKHYHMEITENIYDLFSHDEIKQMEQEHPIIKWFYKRWMEFMINVIIILFLGLISYRNDDLSRTLHLILSIIFLVEFAIYYSVFGKHAFLFEYLRTIFAFINVFSTMMILIEFIVGINERYVAWFDFISKIFMFMKLIRILFFLKLFHEFENIYVIVVTMSSLIKTLLATLLSFFLIFSTVNMYFIGGKIKYKSYINDNDIPNEYYYINFNDWSYSFISCFIFLMVNNCNIYTEGISRLVGEWIKYYFFFFYIIAVVLIINLFNSHIIDMYLNVKNTIKQKKFYNFAKSEKTLVRKKYN
jgi:hypothetical protein